MWHPIAPSAAVFSPRLRRRDDSNSWRRSTTLKCSTPRTGSETQYQADHDERLSVRWANSQGVECSDDDAALEGVRATTGRDFMTQREAGVAAGWRRKPERCRSRLRSWGAVEATQGSVSTASRFAKKCWRGGVFFLGLGSSVAQTPCEPAERLAKLAGRVESAVTADSFRKRGPCFPKLCACRDAHPGQHTASASGPARPGIGGSACGHSYRPACGGHAGSAHGDACWLDPCPHVVKFGPLRNVALAGAWCFAG